MHVLVCGMWMSGTVAGVDGEGAVLQSSDGDTTVVRIGAVNAVRVERARPTADTADDRPAREAASTHGWRPTGVDITRDLAALRRDLLPV